MRMKNLIIIFLFFALTACGRISKPEKPDGSTYPEVYVVRN